MAIGSIVEELIKARAGGYAVPLFNVFEVSCWHDLVSVSESKQAPVIAGMYSSSFDNADSAASAAYLLRIARDSFNPVTLMLDHGSSVEQCINALSVGFTDVMFDGSKLPLDENIAQTRTIVEAAHARGVGVEAELGHVGSGHEYDKRDEVVARYTDPSDVERFVAETGVDLLAIAVGTAHGVYKGEPHLDLDLLEEIAKRVEIPLVLHGGTGLSEAQYAAAIQRGIAKVNIATNLYLSAGKAMVEAATGPKGSFWSITKALHRTIKERMGYYLDLFGASGKAQGEG